MKFLMPVVVALLAPLALGQSLADIPQCAQGCVTTSLSSTGCNPIDVKCFCSASSFISHISCCIKAACSDSDQAKTIKFASDICATVKVTVPTDINSVCAAASSSSLLSPSSTGPSNYSATATATSNPSGSSTGATAIPTTGAAAQFVASGLGLVGAAAAALALL